jgi:hypothetical protein
MLIGKLCNVDTKIEAYDDDEEYHVSIYYILENLLLVVCRNLSIFTPSYEILVVGKFIVHLVLHEVMCKQ